ncbi:hypothetical protein AQUCO_00900590v1 [Aquilegia coerulea]|uniref:Uncharacterized protein n=1 Tax=Aquilegia coerulea TaxID=218851 RepID=A0A2G5EED1_AQUCA|nr:hypothetical protein AQUCO_00900590v1 [Aquilegia coerulea]
MQLASNSQVQTSLPPFPPWRHVNPCFLNLPTAYITSINCIVCSSKGSLVIKCKINLLFEDWYYITMLHTCITLVSSYNALFFRLVIICILCFGTSKFHIN